MSAPDREEVIEAMHGVHEYRIVICAAHREILRENARDVAESLRKWADAAAEVRARRPDAYLEEQMNLSGYIAHNRQLAYQLDPKPVSKIP